MLNPQTARPVPHAAYSPPQPATEIGLSDLFAFVRRRRRLIVTSILGFLALGFLYVTTTPPEYSSTAALVIDSRKVEIFDRGDVASTETLPNSAIETELNILRSTRIANVVVDKLRLTENPEFMEGNPEAFGKLTELVSDWLSDPAPAAPATAGASGVGAPAVPSSPTVAAAPAGGTEATAEAQPAALAADTDRAKRRARGILSSNLRIQRVGLSYAITVSYIASDPARAADIANAVVSAYLEDQVNRQLETARELSSWLQDRIAELRSQGFEADLQALEKSAFRATYDQFLQRYTEALQQESLPSTHAQVISPAEPPGGPRSPNIPLILVGTLAFGTVFGVGSALMRDLLDRTIWRRQQLEMVTQVPCLGVLPTFRVRRSARRRARKMEQLAESGARMFSAGPQYTIVRSAPFSQFAEALRSTRIAAESAPEGPVNVLGIVSSVANEGKTTVAMNLAQFAAGAERVLLIDGDFRNPTLSWNLVPRGSPGLSQLLAAGGDPAGLLWTESATGLRFLPVGVESRQADGSKLLGSSEMRTLMEQLRTKFDFIVVDLPPALPVVDVRAAANLLDAFAFVVEWGVTPDDIVSQAVRDGGLEGRMIGTLLNKVVMSRLRRFERKSVYRATQGYLEPYRHVK